MYALNALIETQKHFLRSWEGAITKFGQIETDLVKLTRQSLKTQEDLSMMRSEVSGFRSDVTTRLDAVVARLTELENMVERSASEPRGARSEIVSMQNEVLNAVQAGTMGEGDIRQLKARLSELERRLALS